MGVCMLQTNCVVESVGQVVQRQPSQGSCCNRYANRQPPYEKVELKPLRRCGVGNKGIRASRTKGVVNASKKVLPSGREPGSVQRRCGIQRPINRYRNNIQSRSVCTTRGNPGGIIRMRERQRLCSGNPGCSATNGGSGLFAKSSVVVQRSIQLIRAGVATRVVMEAEEPESVVYVAVIREVRTKPRSASRER